MRLSAVFHFQGLLALFVAATMLVPLGVSVYYGDGAARAFATASAITALIGILLWWRLRGQVRAITRRDSFAVVSLGWALASAFAALPYLLAGTFANPIDAYFEAMSGFTTTGATVLADIESQPPSILFWRSFTQWLGGVGIIILFVAILPTLGVGAVRMFEDEATGPVAERLTPRIRHTAKALWLIYLALSAALVLILLLRGLSLYDAVTTMFSAIATGGFSPHQESIAAYGDTVVEYVLTLSMIAGGANFGLYYLMWRGHFWRLAIDRELRLYVAIIGGATALVLFDLALNRGHSLADGLRLASFHVVSIQTGSGFATADFDLWPAFSRTILLGLMVVGACAGSTAGGMKVIRVWVLLNYAHRQVFTVFHPRAVVSLKLAGKPISERVLAETVGFAILYIMLLVGATLFVTAFDIDIISAFSAAAATLGCVGPGLGLVGPHANYAALPDPVKVVLTFCMLAGRLEIWTLFVLLRPAYWSSR